MAQKDTLAERLYGTELKHAPPSGSLITGGVKPLHIKPSRPQPVVTKVKANSTQLKPRGIK